MRMSALVALLSLAHGEETRINPHGSSKSCQSCHTEATAQRLGPADSRTCIACHPDADMHPIGMRPDKVSVPPDWPLEDGKVMCITCHDEPAHGGAAAYVPQPYLRGGPYAPPTDLCYVCHERRVHERSDPHHPAEASTTSDPSCSACHSGVPRPGASIADAHLRLDPEQVCTTCHAKEPHYGASDHLGKIVKPDIRAQLPPSVPLLDDGAIACWTCHEVHTTGTGPVDTRPRGLAARLHREILSEDWADLPQKGLRWPGTASADHPPLLAVDNTDGGLCRACHGAGP